MEDFNVANKIALFKSEPYTRYIKLIQQDDTSLLKFNNNGLININNTFIKPPIIKNIFEDIKEHIIEKQKISIKYHNMYNDILYSDNPKSLQKEYDAIVSQLALIDNNIEQMHHYYEIINSKNYDDIIRNNVKKRDFFKLQQSQPKDKKTIIELVNLYKEIYKNNEKIGDAKKLFDKIDFYIVALPEFDIKNKKGKIVLSPKEIPVKDPILKTKSNKVSPQQLNSIKDKVKKLISEKFKFKTKEECISQKRTQPYYMSKPDLIEEIEKHKEIKDLLPPKYQKLTKEKICDSLFF